MVIALNREGWLKEKTMKNNDVINKHKEIMAVYEKERMQ